MGLIVCIDVGNSDTKGKLNNIKIKFSTGITEIDENETPLSNTEVLKYNGKYYLQEPTDYQVKNRLQDNEMFITSLRAIGELLKKNKITKPSSALKLSVGAPINIWNEENKQNYKDYYLFGGQMPDREKENYLKSKPNNFTFKYEDRTYQITITDVDVYPQGYSVCASKKELLEKYPNIHIIDIGGGTVDIVKLQKKRPTDKHQLDYGVLKMTQNVKDILQSKVTDDFPYFTHDDICEIMQGKELSSQEDKITPIIDACCKKYAKMLIKKIKGCADFDFTTPFVLVGGGAMLIKDYLLDTDTKEKMCKGTFDEYANVESYQVIAGAMEKRAKS